MTILFNAFSIKILRIWQESITPMHFNPFSICLLSLYRGEFVKLIIYHINSVKLTLILCTRQARRITVAKRD